LRGLWEKGLRGVVDVLLGKKKVKKKGKKGIFKKTGILCCTAVK